MDPQGVNLTYSSFTEADERNTPVAVFLRTSGAANYLMIGFFILGAICLTLTLLHFNELIPDIVLQAITGLMSVSLILGASLIYGLNYK